jgi:hypothetical protein
MLLGAIPSYRRPRAARGATDSVTTCSEQGAGASLSTSDDLSSSAASTSRLAGGVENNADCFWLVRHHYGESRVGLVKIALDAYGPDETWERTIEAIETGDDIGNALWVPDHLRG